MKGELIQITLPEILDVAPPEVVWTPQWVRISCPDCSYHEVFHLSYLDFMPLPRDLPHYCKVNGKYVSRVGIKAMVLK